MPGSVLELATDIADELSLERPTSIIANTSNNTAQKIFRHMTRTCRQLASRFDWQELRAEHTFTTVATAAQTASTPIPGDFLRLVPDTVFNRTKRYRVDPLSPSEWQAHQATLVTRIYDAFLLRGNMFLMAPTPTAGQTIAYEYITKYIGYLADETDFVTDFGRDSDVIILDRELVILGTVWRYRKAEGTDYAEEFREFEMRLNDLIKMNNPRRVIDMGGGSMDRIPVAPRTPDTLVFS